MNELKKYIANVDINDESMLLDEDEKQRLKTVDSILNHVTKEPSQDINQRIQDLENLITKLQKEIIVMSDECSQVKDCAKDFMNIPEIIMEAHEENFDIVGSLNENTNSTHEIIDDKKVAREIITQDIEVAMCDLKNEITRKLETVKGIKLDDDES